METEAAATDRDAELRRLPSVERLASMVSEVPHHLAVEGAREALRAARKAVLAGSTAPASADLAASAAERAARLARPSLRPVINATGVVLHTNLGRAPLPRVAVEAVAAAAAGYSNLELDLETGSRGSRGHHVEPLLRELSGAEAALVVNNNAAAVMLALAALARGGEVLVSRGELIEIGGSFRIPEILEQSGARLVEVGTTNRTRRGDYERAIGEGTAAILRVHQSNFEMTGFVERSEAAELAALATEHGLAMIEDLGSGALEPVEDEPTVGRSVRAGADLVCCSGDKLLGGPQAGILLGRREAVERCRRHPMARALRLDKLQLAALEGTLRAHREEGPAGVPALAMIEAPAAELRARAEAMCAAVGEAAELREDAARPGGGSLAGVELAGPVCSLDPGAEGPLRLAERLRRSEPPVIVRVARERVILDPRTMSDEEAATAAAAARRALQ